MAAEDLLGSWRDQELLVHVEELAGVKNVLVARTGYSGEDGFEVYIPSDEDTSVKVWNALIDAGADYGIRPCGLGARNTLRLEASMDLSGPRFRTRSMPGSGAGALAEDGQGRAHQAGGALAKVQAEGGLKRKVIGLEIVTRRGEGSILVYSLDGEPAGQITWTPAPFLKTEYAMALVPTAVAASGADVLVDVRGNRVPAKQVPVPFYKRAKKSPVGTLESRRLFRTALVVGLLCAAVGAWAQAGQPEEKVPSISAKGHSECKAAVVQPATRLSAGRPGGGTPEYDRYESTPGWRITASLQSPDRLLRSSKDQSWFSERLLDDEGWWALAWIDAYDLTHDARYLEMAESIFEDMAAGWDERAGRDLVEQGKKYTERDCE